MTKPKARNGFTGSGLNTKEVEKGGIRYQEYLKNYPQLNKPSNLMLLEELVWLECLQERFKEQVGVIIKPTTGPDGQTKIESVPKNLQESIANNLEQIINLKTKLGLFDDKETSDAFKFLEAMFNKATAYRKANPLQFKTTCLHCGKYNFLKRRTDKFEEYKSPFYADDKVLKNDELHACWKEGILPIERYAKAMGVSTDYILWLEEKIFAPMRAKEAQ
jgi:hypothetical protein